MGVGDIKVIESPGSAREFNADDRTTSGASATLKPGEPVKRDNANFCLLVATGDPEIATDLLVGVVKEESTETTSADGKVLVTTLLPGSVLRGGATTAGNVDTAAKLLGLIFDYVAFDVTTGTVTIDEDEGDDPNVHGLCIQDGDIDRGELDVTVHLNATMMAPLIGQTMD